MARDRKPLIEPGSIVPRADDITSRIIERDRINSGRKAPLEAKAKVSSPSPKVYKTSDEERGEDDITENITCNITTQKQSNALRNIITKKANTKEARVLAEELASTALTVVTLRLPSGLNDWLDDYAHAHRKEGVKKQDLVSVAVQMLVAAFSSKEGERGE